MNTNSQIAHLGYQIEIDQDKTRFTARVRRDEGLISHDGRNSEGSGVKLSHDPGYLGVAKNAIDMGWIQ